MSDFQGKFQYLAPDGTAAQQGAFRLHFDAQTLTLTPETGAALAFDLGDLDAVETADYEIRLPLYTGRTIVLRQLGKSYDTLAHDLSDAYRNRTVQCMLLEDMGEIARFTGNFELIGSASESGTAEIRLYKSNLAVLPASAKSFQWRLADVDEVKVDTVAYEITLQSGSERLRITRLGKRTEEFASKLRDALSALATQTAQALHLMLPFLDPDQLQSAAGLLREGCSAPLGKLAAIHKQIPAALAANAVDNDLKPYYDQLVARAAPGSGYAGFKLIRPEGSDTAAGGLGDVQQESDVDAEEKEGNSPDADDTGPETLYWFYFPLASKPGATTPVNVVAWEASSRSGRATYFFRLSDLNKSDASRAGGFDDPAHAAVLVDPGIRRLNRVLAMLNFRRRPIYLSDDDLAMDPRFHRYAIAARRVPEVREVRASFLGRALHSSPEAWHAQMESILAKSTK